MREYRLLERPEAPLRQERGEQKQSSATSCSASHGKVAFEFSHAQIIRARKDFSGGCERTRQVGRAEGKGGCAGPRMGSMAGRSATGEAFPCRGAGKEREGWENILGWISACQVGESGRKMRSPFDFLIFWGMMHISSGAESESLCRMRRWQSGSSLRVSCL